MTKARPHKTSASSTEPNSYLYNRSKNSKMKIKPIPNRKQNTRSLSISLTKGEKLDYTQAETLNQGGMSSFLRFVYEQKKEGATFYYDITDLVTIKTHLEAKLSLAQFHSLLESVVILVEQCTDRGLDYQTVLYGHDHVFQNPDTFELLFVCVPASELKEKRNNILDFLREVAENVSFICEEDQRSANNLLDFLQRHTVFSLLEFQEFLGKEKLSRRKDFDSIQNVDTKESETTSSVAPKKFNFMKAQADISSSKDVRAQQTLAEKIVSDVSDSPSAPITGPTEISLDASESSSALSESTSPSESFEVPEVNTTPSSPLFLVRTKTGTKFRLAEGDHSLGRSSKCDIPIKGNGNISREHACLQIRNSACFLIDRASTNKCFVGGVAIDPETPVELCRGTLFSLADEDFRIE